MDTSSTLTLRRYRRLTQVFVEAEAFVAPRSFVVTSSIVLGREGDLIVSDQHASRQHARLTIDPVRDLASIEDLGVLFNGVLA